MVDALQHVWGATPSHPSSKSRDNAGRHAAPARIRPDRRGRAATGTDHWGDEPVPSMAAVTSIMRVQQILLARLNDTLKPFDLTFPRYEALMLSTTAAAGRCRWARWATGSRSTARA